MAHDMNKWTTTPLTESNRRTSKAVWQRLRLRVLKRDDRQCQVQGPGCTSDANIVDHVVSVANGGGDSEENAQAICPRCHHAKTGREQAALRRPSPGKRQALDIQPMEPLAGSKMLLCG